MSDPDVRRRLQTLRKAVTALWMIGEGELADELAGRTFNLNDINELAQPAELLRFPTLRTIDDEPSSLLAKERDQALVRAVTQLATDGQLPRAETLTSLIIDQLAQAQARTKVVLALAKAGHHERAHALAQSEEQPHRRDSCLRELADALSDLGAIERAEEIARAIKDDFQRVQALIALARKVEPARARFLLAIPLQHGRLSDIMDLVAAACPEAIDIIADHLLTGTA
ncbi:hypothetical protein [Paractinoplanes durhamensis]